MPSDTLRMSPSASDTLADCPRKWYYGYVARIPSGPNESRDTGTEVHDLAERWLKTKDPELKLHPRWDVLAPGLGHLDPGIAWNIETWVEGRCGDLPAVGKIDFWHRVPELLRIGDWKTTGRPGFKYAKSAKGLARATQPLFYAKLLGNRYGRSESLAFQHINLCISEPAAKSVLAENVPWEAVDERWAFLETQAAEMQRLSKATTAEDVPVNTSACRKYGGCPYAAMCPASPENIRARATPNFPDEEVTPMSDQPRVNAANAKFLAFLNGGAKAQPIAAPEVPAEPDAVSRAVAALKAVKDEGLLTEAVIREFAASHKADPDEVSRALGFGAQVLPAATPQDPVAALKETLALDPHASEAEQKAVVKAALGRLRMSDAEFKTYQAKVLGTMPREETTPPVPQDSPEVVSEAENPKVYEDTEVEVDTGFVDAIFSTPFNIPAFTGSTGAGAPESAQRPGQIVTSHLDCPPVPPTPGPRPSAFLGCFPEDGGFSSWGTGKLPGGDIFVPLSQEREAIPTLRALGYRIIRGAL